MKHALIFHRGRACWATLSSDGAALLLPSGEAVPIERAAWLPPATPGAAIYALGLNYADHNKELGFSAVHEKPLVFLKGQHSLVGHEGVTLRPTDADQMHPECELVAVVGREARRVTRADALAYISGYTVANDYAIREYLENYYRPNARVKNRDATTPLGPWVVDASDVGDPQCLALATTVNGQLVQQGSTADMIMDVAGLVEYLSSFVTLMPGDMILTGTPQGVHFVAPGDRVVCEIEKVGRLVNCLDGS